MKDLFFAARILVLLFVTFLLGDHLFATDRSFWSGLLYILFASVGLSAVFFFWSGFLMFVMAFGLEGCSCLYWD